MHRSRALSFAASTFLAALVASSAARAESATAAPQCSARITPENVTVPASTPALVVAETSSPGLTTTVTITQSTPSIALERIADPRSPGVTLFMPKADAPFEVGTKYALTYVVGCNTAQAPVTTTSTFNTGPTVTLPTALGTVRAVEAARGVVSLSPELAAYLHTTRFDAYINDRLAGSTRYGSAKPAERAGPAELDVSISDGYVLVGGAPTIGGTAPDCEHSGAEKYVVKIAAHVAGAGSDPDALSFSIAANCPPRNAEPVPMPVVLPDGGGDDRGASGGSDGGGCAMNGAGSLGRLGIIFGVGAALAVLLRRRRVARDGGGR